MPGKWYVIRTEPRTEYLAADELARDGFEILFLRVKVIRPRVGHTDIPLFPGYLLIRCHPEAEGWPVFRPGHRVLGWVGFAGEVPSLPDEAVTELMQRVDAINGGGGLWKRFQAGERVRIVSHSLEGLAEVVEAAKSPQARVKVLLNFMDRLVSAQVPWEHLRPVEEGTTHPERVSRRTRGHGRWIRGFAPRATVST